ncbi:cupin domain-containing protein [Halorarum salinum]|uniref:Cupin domain-containing protein n=1 Tax=Halorarum salinum TaxID=2743089 RepID=A0A7D5LDG2_9EURY|nr:cupin domain-containing protein [Halobaculum salinum]
MGEANRTLPGDGVYRRGLSGTLGTTDVAINRYRIAPDEGFPGGLHAHPDQEEVFVVLEGEATFETWVPRGEGSGADGDVPGGADEVAVAAGEAARFAPGEFQSGRNEADSDLVALAVGAPRDGGDVRLPLPCPDCGHGDVRLDAGGEEFTFICPDCSAERVPAPCPDCGHDDLRATLSERDRPVARCWGCGAEFESAPVRD